MDDTRNNEIHRTVADRYHDMSEMLQTGWWEYDRKRKTFIVSDFIMHALGLKNGKLSLEASVKLIGDGYRKSFKEYFETQSDMNLDANKHKFSMKTSCGDIWVVVKVGQRLADETDYDFGTLTVEQEEKTADHQMMVNTDYDAGSNNKEYKIDREKLLKYMPIGYTRIMAIRSSQTGEIDNYRITEVNMHSSYLYGMHGEEEGLLGSEVHDSSVFEENIRYFKEVIDNGEFVADRVLTPSGVFCRRFSYKSGEDEVVEFNVDMSETIGAMDAAQRSEELFRNVFMNLPIGVSIYDTNGYIKDMNKSFMDIYGLRSRDDIMNYSFFDDVTMTDDTRNQIEKESTAVLTVNYDFAKVDNYTTYRRDKAIVNCKVVHLFHHQQDVGFLIISIEETDMLIAKNKVKEFENYFSLISDFAKIGYAKINLLGEDSFGIRQWYRNFNENEKKPVREIISTFRTLHRDDRKELMDFVEKARLGEAEHFSKIMKVKGHNGKKEEKWIYHGVLLSEYAPDRGIIEFVGVNYDITDLKKTEHALILARDKAQELDRLKSAFLANMSHEIRTPLNAIVGFSNLLISSTDEEERKSFFDILEKNNDQLLKLINDILDLSKIEAGTMDFKYEDVDINDLCRSITMSMRLKVTNSVKIVFAPTEQKCHITTDSIRMNQLISNLMNNAIKFTEQGQITLTYALEGKSHIRFSITDTGVGIDAKNRKRIFERFVKLNTFVPGTGLGLSICSSIVNQMGGKIGVDSGVGKGSCFWFVLPKKGNPLVNG